MKILQGGVPKCGNFWLYQILQQILNTTGEKKNSFISKQPIYELAKDWELNYPSQASIDVLDIMDSHFSYRISSIFKMPIDNLEEYVAQTNHVWTHSPICKSSGEVFNLFDKKVYIVRDPRDRAISAANYYCSDYMLKYFPQEIKDPEEFLRKNFEKLIQNGVWHVFDHLKYAEKYNIHIAFYEGFLLDFQQELKHLLNYLKIDLTNSEKEELEAAVSFNHLKKENPKHLKKGKTGYWMEQLNDEQIKTATALAGPLIQYLGYLEKKEMEMTFSRNPPHIDFEKLKEEIMEFQSTFNGK